MPSRASGSTHESPVKSDTTATKPRRLLTTATRSMAPARSARPRPSDDGAEAALDEDGAHLVAPEPGRHHLQLGPADEHGTEAVLVARREEPDGGGGDEPGLRLVGHRRAEAHRRRHVDDDPRLEVAVGDLVADVGLLGAGGDVPVDASRIVARLVEPGLTRLAAVPGRDALVVAVQGPVQAPGDRQLERAHELGDLLGRRARGPLDPSRAVDGRCPWLSPGRGSASATPTSPGRSRGCG